MSDNIMARFLLFAFLFVCLVYMLQASPLPQDAQQPASNDDDSLANKAKKIFDDAKGALENSELSDAFEKAKTFLGQAGESIRKEIGNIAEKLRE